MRGSCRGRRSRRGNGGGRGKALRKGLAPALEDEGGPGELFVWRFVADLTGHLEALAEGRGGAGAEDGDAAVGVLAADGALAAIGVDGTDDRAGDGDLLAVEARRGVEDRADGGGGGGARHGREQQGHPDDRGVLHGGTLPVAACVAQGHLLD